MILKIPVTASNMIEWVRRAAGAVNALILTSDALDGRMAAVETFAALPFTVGSITLTPVALPGAPTKGQTVYDIADNKVKTWDGAIWQAHY